MPSRARRAPALLAALLALAALPLAGLPVAAQTTPVDVEPVFTVDLDPVGLAHAGDGSGRLFVVQQPGVISIWDGSQVLATPFLDIQGRVGDGGSEQGLLGLAFHPDFATNELFYVNYTDNSGDTVVSSFTLLSADVADPASENVVLTIAQPFSNHNGGNLVFGPDGYLYIGTGDGGSGGDPQNNGQSLDTLLGKMLRIDVDGDDFPADPDRDYAIPADNPFVGDPDALDEIWAYGLRNPWRYSFDRDTGDLFIGDVGQSSIEEIDLQDAASAGGENYGWRLMEGSECFDPPTNCNDGTLVLPILEYGHFDGGFNCSVTGGFRYRGDLQPLLDGIYLYGDYCSGRIWGGVESGGDWLELSPKDTSLSIVAFGEDEAGELYVANIGDQTIYSVFDTRPYCEVEPDATSYAEGDTVVAQRLRVVNRGTAAATVRVVVGYLDPTGDATVLLDRGGDGSFQVPAGTNLDAGPRDLFTVDAGTETGTWTLACRFLDPTTGAVLADDDAPFTVE